MASITVADSKRSATFPFTRAPRRRRRPLRLTRRGYAALFTAGVLAGASLTATAPAAVLWLGALW